MQPDDLAERIKRFAWRMRESRQIAERLLQLLPETLRRLQRNQHPLRRGATAERLALTDPEYLAKLDQYVGILGEALEAKIQFETHRMLRQAQRSIEALERVQRRQKI